jgi:hypothetical protein
VVHGDVAAEAYRQVSRAENRRVGRRYFPLRKLWPLRKAWSADFTRGFFPSRTV